VDLHAQYRQLVAGMGKILVIVALASVAFILLAGLFVMSMGGQIDKKWSNRLMRYRVLAQAVAILIVLAVLYFSQQQ
jgi:tryptophan-rich sensory protein